MVLGKYHILYILMLLFASLLGTKIHAQQTLVDVDIDVADIMIGEQTMLHLNCSHTQTHIYIYMCVYHKPKGVP